jgi:Domain of unknown function (DUF5069)
MSDFKEEPCPLPSPYEAAAKLVYFPRLIEKIRLHQQGQLPTDFQENFGDKKQWVLDDICCRFLRLSHAQLQTLVTPTATNEEILEQCWLLAGRRSEHEIDIWSGWITRVGWRDAQSPRIAVWKKDLGRDNDESLQTLFDLLDAEEGRR